MEIKQGKNSFYIGEDENNPLAEITYIQARKDKIIINHTYVPKEYEGQEIGSKLMGCLIQWARENDLMVLSTCSFAFNKLKTKSEYQDVSAI